MSLPKPPTDPKTRNIMLLLMVSNLSLVLVYLWV